MTATTRTDKHGREWREDCIGLELRHGPWVITRTVTYHLKRKSPEMGDKGDDFYATAEAAMDAAGRES